MSKLSSIEALLGNLPKVDADTAAQAAKARKAPTLAYAPIPVPDLALPLLDFQVEGVERALKLRRAIIADEMGLGKTPQGIACAVAAVHQLDQRPVLVVVPPSLRTNWVREFAKFAPNLRVATLLGTKGGEIPTDADVLVIGDASLSGKTTKQAQPDGRTQYVTTLKGWAQVLKGQIGALVVDEAHRFKNYKAGRTVALTAIAQELPEDAIRVLLSGTIVVNAPIELTSPLQIIDRLRGRTQFGSLRDFQARYAPVIDDWGKRGAANTLELNERLRDLCMIRRLRSEVLTLPNKGRTAVALDMDAATARRYDYAEADLRAYLTETRGRVAAERAMQAEALVKLGVLRRLAGYGKVKAVTEYVLDQVEQGEQVFVATWHVDVAKGITEALRAKGTEVVQIVGGMSDKAKDASVQAFQGSEAQVLVGNIVAAGVGFTLTAARHIVLAELPWTPGDLQQVEDRLHRIGQEREVVSHVTIAATEAPSIDAHVWGIIEDKAAVVGEVLDGEAKVLIEDTVIQSLLDYYRD